MVISSRPSGTSIAISGFSRAAMSIISLGGRHLQVELDVDELAQPPHVLVLDVAAILAQVDGDAVGSAQVRFDGRPDRVGLVGAPRLPQRRDVVDVDTEFNHGRSFSCSQAHVERLQLLDDAAALHAALLEVMIENFAHQPLRLGRGLGVRVAAVGQRQQRRAAHDRPAARRIGRRAPRAAIEGVMVTRGRIDRAAGVGLAHERQRVAQLGEQQNLEAPQHRRLFAARGEVGQRRLVAREKARMRIFPRQELEQELVQVEAADERRAADPREPSPPFRMQQRLQLLLTRPRQEQRLEPLQEPPQFRARAARAARHHRDPAVFGGERLDDHARLAIRKRVQHECRLVVAAQRLGAGGHRTRRIGLNIRSA